MNKMQVLSAVTCNQLLRGLARVLSDGDPAVPSETVELVDAVIDYCSALEGMFSASNDNLSRLISARAAYDGPGIRGYAARGPNALKSERA